MTVYQICFSPTGGTKKVADYLTHALSEEAISVDLTDSRTDFDKISLTPDDLAIIAVPSYGGRVPAPEVERLAALQGNGAHTVLVCVYGNRAYEDTLMELQDTTERAGFRTIAAVAAIAEHSIAHQFATGRPDAQDAQQLAGFAKQIGMKIATGNDTQPSLPGNRPYKKASGAVLIPKPTKDCVNCGLCAAKCPMQAIDTQNSAKVDSKACISCMRCVSICPHAARKVNRVLLSTVGLALKKSVQLASPPHERKFPMCMERFHAFSRRIIKLRSDSAGNTR